MRRHNAAIRLLKASRKQGGKRVDPEALLLAVVAPAHKDLRDLDLCTHGS